ncbi:TetR/AcrR family transcriptional regulator [Granulicella cerasi]|uniref:TetR/AcrR family transcriptional regulator n=1 Tax=Granulicella cerasi TaxID=741063 RepID=UPI0021E0F820|nr:TetR/AcrR family transcriptional regulator [Granulicella cerasi]
MRNASGTEAHRDKVLKVALALLTKHGRDAVTTRSVAEAAKVQPPVLYRLFGDKDGLLDAVTAYGFSGYLAKKQSPASGGDPVEGLRVGWDLHVEFGLGNPELYLLMYANPRPGAESPAAQKAFAVLDQHMQRVAAAGRLRVSVARACALYHAAAVGIVMLLLSQAPEQRDLGLSAIARDHALSGITNTSQAISSSTLPAVANQMHALLGNLSGTSNVLSDAERSLLLEWMQRLLGSPV